MTDPASLAVAAVAALAPYLAAAGQKAAEALGENAPKALASLWGWVKGKVTGRAPDKFAAAPEDAKAQGALETALEDLLTADPALKEELQKLVAAAEPEAAKIVQTTQTMNLSGGSKGAQTAGSGNKVNIS